jgi:hypothetical protein
VSRALRRELAGYVVWGAMGVVVAVPELWAAVGGKSVPWPTISGTVGYLEYWHAWIAIIVIGILVWAAFHSVQYSSAPPAHARRTAGGRLTHGTPRGTVNAIVYFASAVAVVVGGSLWAHIDRPHDKYRFGEVLYGLIGFCWIVVPTIVAYVWERDTPFPTLFQTIRSMERRVRLVAVVFAAGITVLLLHLALYPWPAVIPDLQRLHAQYAPQGHTQKKLKEPPPYSP